MSCIHIYLYHKLDIHQTGGIWKVIEEMNTISSLLEILLVLPRKIWIILRILNPEGDLWIEYS